MTNPLTDTATVGLGRFIRENRFTVPTHQRDYSWTKEYVTAFLEDIDDALSRRSEIYFCGLMVFTNTPYPILKVLDGQQRLATTIMLFAAIRNWFGEYSEFYQWRDQIQRDYIGNAPLGSLDQEPKLSLTPPNNPDFHKFVINAVPVADIVKAIQRNGMKDRSRTLLKAALQINRHVAAKAATFSDHVAAKDHFFRMAEYLNENVKLVSFILTGDDAAYTIFETLNDRGLELAPLELVKNYLFSRAERHRSGSLKEFEERWAEMMLLLGPPRADSFLRTFWASRHGKMKGTALFTEFKEEYNTPQKAYDVSVDMREDAERYAALFSAEDPIWAGYSAKTRSSVDGLSKIGSTQMHPIILSALPKFDKHQMERLLWLLEVIAVRFQLVGRGRPGRIESNGGRVARDIYTGDIKTAQEVFSRLKELYLDDATFGQRFADKREGESKKARYLLTGLEKQSLLREGKTFHDELVPGNVTLEHILPKSPGVYWQGEIDADDDLSKDMLYRLGNLCLLPDVNHSLGNKPWADKVKVYERSRLNLTNKLAQYQQWGRAEIEDRQRNMAELAKAFWRFP